MTKARTLAVAAVLVLLVAAGAAWQILSSAGGGEDAGPGARLDVVFVVVDMVRADRLSACGHGRPTSPVLERLFSEPGTAATCGAVSPGTWTLPSHASYFTGEEVPVHGADGVLEAEGADTVSLWGDRVRPLPAGLPTLAERMKERGYRTVLVSGNPIVSGWSGTGLARGFDVVREARQFGDTYGDRLVWSLGEALDSSGERGGDRPLFLFVNVCDAHHPWEAIPPGIDWVPPRIALDNRPRDPANPYPRFFRDQLSPEERALFLALISDSYDWAVHRADRTLGKVLALLEGRGALGPDHRLVIASDHGEYLGEHDLLSHGIFVHEQDTRVPLVFRERRGGEVVPPPALEAPISALTAFDLVLDGALPEAPRPVRAAGYPDGLLSRLFGERLMATTAALWDGDRKLFWKNGEYSVFDLASDPGEERPLPLAADDPLRAGFEAFVEQVKVTGLRKTAPTPEMIEALRRLGYVE